MRDALSTALKLLLAVVFRVGDFLLTEGLAGGL